MSYGHAHRISDKMKKLIKWSLQAAVLMMLLTVLLMLAISLLFDPNDFKHHVTEFVQQKTGHQFEIKGPVELRWFPSAGLQLSGVELNTSQDAEGHPLFTAASLGLEVNLWALLEHQVRIDELTLKQPVLNLVSDQKGQGNWESLLYNPQDQGGRSNDSGAPDSGFTLTIHSFQLQDASVHFQDNKSGKGFDLKQLNISTGYLLADNPVSIEAQLSLSMVQPAMNLVLLLDGELHAAENFEEIEIPGLVIEATAREENSQAAVRRLKLVTDLNLNFPDESFQLNDLTIAGADTHITGQLDGKGFSGLPQLNGQLAMQETNLRSWLIALGVEVDTPDSRALTRVSAEVGLQQQDESLLLHPIQVQLDDSMIHGRAQITMEHTLRVDGQLTIDRIDLDRYLVKRKAGEGSGFQLSAGVEILRKLQLDAEIAIDQLTLGNINLQQVTMEARSENGVMLLEHW